MPRTRSRSVRNIITEIVMYVGMFVIVGHLCQNLCERFMMQKDLKTMKADINLLEMVINNIEIAYDNLRDEIQHFLQKELRNPSSSCIMLCAKRLSTKCTKKLKCVETEIEKKTTDFMQNFKKSTNDFIHSFQIPVKDETTLTERLLKCLNLADESEEITIEPDHYKYIGVSMTNNPNDTSSHTLDSCSNHSIQDNVNKCKVIEFPPETLTISQKVLDYTDTPTYHAVL